MLHGSRGYAVIGRLILRGKSGNFMPKKAELVFCAKRKLKCFVARFIKLNTISLVAFGGIL